MDEDGQISFEEFQAAMASSYSRKETDMLESAFSKLDLNNDGYLDRSQIAKVLQHSQESLDE